MFLPVPILHLGMVEQVSDLRRHAQHLHWQQSMVVTAVGIDPRPPTYMLCLLITTVLWLTRGSMPIGMPHKKSLWSKLLSVRMTTSIQTDEHAQMVYNCISWSTISANIHQGHEKMPILQDVYKLVRTQPHQTGMQKCSLRYGSDDEINRATNMVTIKSFNFNMRSVMVMKQKQSAVKKTHKIRILSRQR